MTDTSKEKPISSPVPITKKILEITDRIQDLRFHIFKLEKLRKQYESEGRENDARMTDFFIEDHKKEISILQKKLEWENLKLSSLINKDASDKLIDWKKRIELIKSTLSIDQVASRYVKLMRSGNKLTGKCPFHNDRTPSFVVYPETSSFYCFGCQKNGDIFTFVMEVEKLSFKEAVELLSRYPGLNN